MHSCHLISFTHLGQVIDINSGTKEKLKFLGVSSNSQSISQDLQHHAYVCPGKSATVMTGENGGPSRPAQDIPPWGRNGKQALRATCTL